MSKSLFFIWLSWGMVILPALCEAQVLPKENGKILELDGASIYYEEYGNGEPLLLLHGFGRTLEDWKPLIPEFARQYRVIAWDMRGHGRSSSGDTTEVFLHQRAASDLLALIQALDLEKVKAIGHSSGGILLLQAASQRPEAFEAIIPVSAQLQFSQQVRDFIRQNAKPEDFYEFNELEAQHGAAKGRLLARQFYHFSELQGDPATTFDQLRHISARSLIIHGDDDFVPVSEAWEMHLHLDNPHLWIVPNGGHLPHLGPQREADFTRIVLEFLDGSWTAIPPRE